MPSRGSITKHKDGLSPKAWHDAAQYDRRSPALVVAVGLGLGGQLANQRLQRQQLLVRFSRSHFDHEQVLAGHEGVGVEEGTPCGRWRIRSDGA